ncbi:hypothetical protein [Sinorhizobium medicae]|uniref:hypothetical protein n=1 Tax=Sinorhizobium medicae TaxID=110321 RepID=UPI000FDAD42A|nr:hypothetical protein [Sinorhizobium medicae]RVJ23442.1 hypothetical protein CN179_24805 [Sinorhizobium medicae]
MPSIFDLYPRRYLSSEDLKGQRYTLTIDRVVVEDVGDDGGDKPVLYFRGAKKGMVLNLTNGDTLATAYGADYTQWPGKPVEVYFDPDVTYKGRRTGGIRVDVPASEIQKLEQLKREAKPDQKPDSNLQDDLNDRIPF